LIPKRLATNATAAVMAAVMTMDSLLNRRRGRFLRTACAR
jgi:hypothetical protein